MILQKRGSPMTKRACLGASEVVAVRSEIITRRTKNWEKDLGVINASLLLRLIHARMVISSGLEFFEVNIEGASNAPGCPDSRPQTVPRKA
jgi:hypothetical protein